MTNQPPDDSGQPPNHISPADTGTVPLPSTPTSPLQTPPQNTAGGNPFDRLERQIRFVCLHILRGQRARRRWELKAYYLLRIVTLILSALAGAGLIADKVSGNLTVATGWAFWGALLVLAFGILVQIADVFGVEKVATHARVLADICDRYETELGTILEDPDPMDSLVGLAGRVRNSLLDPSNHVTVPRGTTVRADADRLAADLIREYRSNWTP